MWTVSVHCQNGIRALQSMASENQGQKTDPGLMSLFYLLYVMYYFVYIIIHKMMIIMYYFIYIIIHILHVLFLYICRRYTSLVRDIG